MLSKGQFQLAVAITIVAVLNQITVDTGRWEVTETGIVATTPEELSRFLVNPDTVERWFYWVPHLKAADSRPLGVGKKFNVIYSIPYVGEYEMLFTVTEYQADKKIVAQSDLIFKPQFTILLESVPADKKSTKVAFKLRHRRSSALFQWTLGPMLCFLSGQQLQQSLFFLKMMFPF